MCRARRDHHAEADRKQPDDVYILLRFAQGRAQPTTDPLYRAHSSTSRRTSNGRRGHSHPEKGEPKASDDARTLRQEWIQSGLHDGRHHADDQENAEPSPD